MADNIIFTNAKLELVKRIGDMEINTTTIINVLRFSMEVVEATTLKGKAQSELAQKLVREIVVEAPISDDKEKLLLDMIDQGVLSNTIELIVQASNGELDLNTVMEVGAGCCLPLCRNIKTKK